MRVKPLLLYLNAKEKEYIRINAREKYKADILVAILRQATRENKVKTWTEIENDIFNQVAKDDRTAKQIEEDTLNRFKKLGG